MTEQLHGASGMSKISVEGLNLYYGDFRALSGISIDIQDREITALIGPSGCGKSSFLRCLNRMNDTIPGTRVEGKVLLDGKDIYRAGIDLFLLRRRVGQVCCFACWRAFGSLERLASSLPRVLRSLPESAGCDAMPAGSTGVCNGWPCRLHGGSRSGAAYG